jgi:hypothetical protein
MHLVNLLLPHSFPTLPAGPSKAIVVK